MIGAIVAVRCGGRIERGEDRVGVRRGFEDGVEVLGSSAGLAVYDG